MIKRTVIFATVLMLIGLGTWVYLTRSDDGASNHKGIELREMVANSRSENPRRGLPHDWLDCLERYQSEADFLADKVECRTWAAQGVRSTLFALKAGEDRIPLIESRLEDVSLGGPLVVDIVGGPGGEPFHINPALTEEFIARLREDGLLEGHRGAIAAETAQYQIMERGFTIASVGYWGMSIRTFNVADEIELAVSDVRHALDHYRDELGEDPPLIVTSLGNHLALGAMGKERLERANVLSLVPVMDGLQHHLERVKEAIAKERADAAEQGRFGGNLTYFNIYSQSSNGTEFDHSRMLNSYDFVVQFVGKADFPWHQIRPSAECSKTVLGSKDPRTKAYLAAEDDLPAHIEVWESDHDLAAEHLDRMRGLYASYADCLLAQKS